MNIFTRTSTKPATVSTDDNNRLESYDFQVGRSLPIFRLPRVVKYIVTISYIFLIGSTCFFCFSWFNDSKLSTTIAAKKASFDELNTQLSTTKNSIKTLMDSSKRKNLWIPLLTTHNATTSYLLAKLLEAIPSSMRITNLRLSPVPNEPYRFSLQINTMVIAKDKTAAAMALSDFRKAFTNITTYDIVDNRELLKSTQQATYRGADAHIFQVEDTWVVEVQPMSEDKIIELFKDLSHR